MRKRRQYIRGFQKPRYPVPAVIHTVEISPDRVVLWTKLANHKRGFKLLAFRMVVPDAIRQIINRYAEVNDVHI